MEKVRGISVRIEPQQEYLIGLLNPVIRGWANYHRHIAAGRRSETGMDHLAGALAMGQTQTSEEVRDWIVDRYWHRLGRRIVVLRGDWPERQRSRSWFGW